MLPTPGHTPEELRGWLEIALTMTGWSPSKLATEAGLSPSTLNRFIAGGSHVLSNTTVARLEAAAIRRIRERVASGDLTGQEEGHDPFKTGHKGRMILIKEVDPRGAAESPVTWGFPENWFKFTFSADATDCEVIPIEDDGMAPDLRHGDRVVVDLRQADPSMPGLFIIETPAGLVARRLEAIPHEAGLVRMQPRNPDYMGYDVPAKTLKIRGRIVGMWRRL